MRHRLAEGQPQSQAALAGGEERLEHMRQHVDRHSRPGVAHDEMPVFARAAQVDHQVPVVDLDLVERLHRVEQQVVHDLLQRARVATHAERLPRHVDARIDAVAAQLGLQHMQGAPRQGRQVDVFQARGLVGLADHVAQAVDHVGHALRVHQGVLHRQLAGQQVRGVLVEHPVGDAGVGEHLRHRLVQVVGHAGGQFSQRVEPRHLAQPQQLVGAPAVGAQAQQRPCGEQQQRHQQRPGGHLAPGQLAPAHLALRHQLERLAGAGQRLVVAELPAGRTLGGDAPDLQHEALARVLQRHAHRARVGGHRPLAPGHHAAHVDLHRVAGGVGGHHQLVAPPGDGGLAQYRPAQLARLRLGRHQVLLGPQGLGVAVQDRHDLRVDRLQALLRPRRVAAGAQQRQRGQQGVVLAGAVVEQAVGHTRVVVEGLLQPGELVLPEYQAPQRRDDQPARKPGRMAL